MTHPETLANLTLPLRTNGAALEISGDCRGNTVVMLTAGCVYNQEVRKSTWTSIQFTNCSVDCLAQTVSHSVTDEVFQLSNAIAGQTNTFKGMCGRREQDMFGAVCMAGGWNVTELECVLMCLPGQISHSQWAAPLPTEEVPVSTTYTFDMPCDKANKTIITARCELNAAGTDGVWTNIVMESCVVQCQPELITHPAGTSWNLSLSGIGYAVGFTGMCDGSRSNLGAASCQGDLANGASWNVSLTTCDVRCPLQTFVHPDTKSSISLGTGQLNETQRQSVICNGEPLPMEAECRGSLSGGGNWRLTNMLRCAPVCLQTDWFDIVTNEVYTVEQTDFLSEFSVRGFCGGKEKVLMVATCSGDIVTGVEWRFDNFNCTPSCDIMQMTHNDTNSEFTFPATLFNQTIALAGKCNGKEESDLVSATCGGNIADAPEWTFIKPKPCVGYCVAVNVNFTDFERVPYLLDQGTVGDSIVVNGTCALLTFVEIEAECVGDARDGGIWNYTLHL